MSLTFANLWGLLALLGIPAVILIHFLQRKSTVITISTQFLLEQIERESEKGNRVERLRTSLPFWIQLLMVLLLTWLLVEPRWIKKDSFQRIALVLDSSYSMGVFKQELIEQLKTELTKLSEAVKQTEYFVLESDTEREKIYRGNDLIVLQDKLVNWVPQTGSHEFTDSLRTARSLVGQEGLVILVTDHVHEKIPYDAKLLSVGSPQPNCGFCGLSFKQREGQLLWNVLLRNYSSVPQQRSWWLQSGNRKTEKQTVMLAPNQLLTLQGVFPERGADTEDFFYDHCVLLMEEDVFSLDDRLPMVRPQPKELTLKLQLPSPVKELIEKVISSFEDVSFMPTGEQADLFFTMGNGEVLLPPQQLICCLQPLSRGENYLQGNRVITEHPLIEGLNWQNLIVKKVQGISLTKEDEVLLWQGEYPLIFLRSTQGKEQLVLNFDLVESNVDKLPAFVLLLHRFLEKVRAQKVTLEIANRETGQKMWIAAYPEKGPLQMIEKDVQQKEILSMDSFNGLSLAQAPAVPCFFEVSQQEESLFYGAAHFADARESDLQQAGAANEVSPLHTELLEKHSQRSSRWRFWMIFLGGLLIASWAFTERNTSSFKKHMS